MPMLYFVISTDMDWENKFCMATKFDRTILIFFLYEQFTKSQNCKEREVKDLKKIFVQKKEIIKKSYNSELSPVHQNRLLYWRI